MNFINNLVIKKKLLLLISLPILALLYFTISQNIEVYNKLNKLEKVEPLVESSTIISRLVHETQKERGMTAGYLGSKGKKFSTKLKGQRELTDKVFAEFESFVKNIEFDNSTKNIKANFQKAINQLKQRNSIRSSVDSFKIKASKAISYYTNINTIVLDSIMEIAKHIDNVHIAEEIISYANFLMAKERAGIERAVGTNTLSRDSFGSGMRTKFSNLISEQKTFLKVFRYYASTEALVFYEKQMKSKAVNEVNRIRKTLLSSIEKHAIIAHIEALVGYGGLIHNYKNFVIRADSKYQERVQTQYNEILEYIDKYNSLGNVTQEEKKLLEDFTFVVTKYYKGLESIEFAVDPDDVKAVDEIIKVDDTPAVKALKKLATGLFSDESTYWFEQITKKINSLKKVDDFLSEELHHNIYAYDSSLTQQLTIVLTLSIVILLVVFVFATAITKNIITSLHTFKEGLGYFFEYAIREKDYLKPMEVNGSDEFAQMTAEMNEQIKKTEYIIEQDKKVVIEIDEIMKKVRSGFFVFSIKQRGATSEVEALRQNINDMLSDTKIKLDAVNKILDSYASGNYDYKFDEVKRNKMYGDMGSLLTSTMLLGTSTSQLMAMISNAGDELRSTTQVLTGSSQRLSTSSNAQAASLEETAAAVEQITSNIQNNSETVTSMSFLADELNSTAKTGEELASQTASAMDEINQKVTAINEAITVIDQIAFQTNILSLNAAVEAATAGEAGKGFAVVAQEVRNLAARSAEAAKDIKDLVEDATSKSNIGKDTSIKMIEGYGTLNEKVIQTKEMIDTVTSASKEQEEGMLQINDAINNLDQTTQENASTASQIDGLASQVSVLSDRLMTITSQASFDQNIKNQVCDVDLVREVSKYKNDHINFKDNNFAKLDSLENWSVTDFKSCNLGKWIGNCESEGKEFVNSTIWSSVKQTHEKLHGYVQEYVTLSSQKADNNELDSISKNIEESTYEIFNKLDELLEHNCSK